MTEPTGPTPEQLRAITEAQTPEAYMAAARAAGMTGDAEQAALAGAHPVTPPDFSELLAQAKRDSQAQIDKLQHDFELQIAALRAGIPPPTVDPRIPVARNLVDGVSLLARSYPYAARVDPVTASAGQLAAALEPADGDGGTPPVPDPGLVADLIKKFRRFAEANPQLETGLIEHAAQVTEDVFDL